MPLHVRHSNHLEQLVDLLLEDADRIGAALSDEVAAEQREVDIGPLGPKTHVVVPNYNLQAYVDYETASRRGISLGNSYTTIESFLSGLLPETVEREVDGESVTFDVETLDEDVTLKLVLDFLLEERLDEDPSYAPVRSYLDQAPNDDVLHQKRYQLAERIAKMFREYRDSRPGMLEQWSEGLAIDDEEFRETERWQRAMWSAIFGPEGTLREIEREEKALYVHPPHVGTEFGRVEAAPDKLPAAVHVFALSYAFPVYAPVFRHLHERGIWTFLYALNPCGEKWDEIVTDWHEEHEQLLSSEPVEGGAIGRHESEHSYWETLDEAHRPPDALRLWGRAGRDAMYFVEELSDELGHRVERFVDPADRDRDRTSEVGNRTSDEARSAERGTRNVEGEARKAGEARDAERGTRESENGNGGSGGGERRAESGELPLFDEGLADGAGGREPAPRLLGQIQRDIMHYERRSSPREDFGDRYAGDRSIQVLGAPGVRRELEIIADEIWALIRGEREGFEAGELDFNDIAVIVNHRERERYHSYLDAVFDEAQQLPYNLIDLQASRESRLLEAVDLLFALPFSEFKRRDLLKLLCHPNLVANHAEADAEEWLEWCDELDILHGADRKDHRDTYIDEDLYNWDQGLKRLVLGAFMADDARSMPGDGVFELGQFAYLPQELSSSAVPTAARLVKTVRALIGEAREKKTREQSLEAWADELASWVRKHLAPAEGDQEYDVVQLSEQLREIGQADPSGRPVPYRIAWEMARAQIDEMKRRRGHYLIDGVVVSSFQPMRPLPFEVVFVTGLGEGEFPSSDPRSQLDLRRAQWKRGDAKQRDKDRYMFLETLVSTRQRLYMSYVSRDSQTGDPIEPSTIVRELQAIIDRGYVDPEDAPEPVDAIEDRDEAGERHWTEIRHPLRRYANPYFEGDREEFGPPSNEEAYRERAAERLRRDLQEACRERGREVPSLEELREWTDEEVWQTTRELLGIVEPKESAPEEEIASISMPISRLRRFLESPLQAGAQYVLGIREDDEDDPFEREDEPFETGPLEKAILLRRVFVQSVTDPNVEADEVADLYDRVARRMELDGAIPSGVFHDVERDYHLDVLEDWRGNVESFGIDLAEPLETVRFGRGYGEVYSGEVCDSIAFTCEIERGGALETVEVELYGDTQPLAPDWRTSFALAASKRSSLKRERYYLRGFFDAIALAAGGAIEPGGVFTCVCNHGKSIGETQRDTYSRRIRPPGREEAVEYLRLLVEEMYGGAHDYLLPLEIGADARLRGNGPLEDLVDRHVRGYYNKTSCKYGPIADPGSFELPEDADAMIDRRFGLYFENVLTDDDE